MSKYRALGVDVKKEGIQFFRNVVDNLYPGAFCVITRDPSNPKMGLVSHTDSAGSKPIMSYLCYKESGDPTWFKGLAQDAIAMNIDDIICVGAEPISFIDYIAFNTLLIDRVEMLSSLSDGFQETFQWLSEYGVKILFGGGETADLPDQLKTLDVCGALFGKVELEKVVTGRKIAPGDIIVGLESGGKIKYEKSLNSGIMCNGHTLARNCLIKKEYIEKYPEIGHPDKSRFTGNYEYDNQPKNLGMTIGEALTSPTRIFAPIVLEVFKALGDSIHGMIHNTGGGQTKCLTLGNKIRYVKDTLPDPDPIFHLIQKEGNVEWREMYEDFNMGIGFEFIVKPEEVKEVINISKRFGIGVKVVGQCEKGEVGNNLTIKSEFGTFEFT